MSAAAEIILECCSEEVSVSFRHAEAPFLPANTFRKNVVCPACHTLVILTLTKSDTGAARVKQEVIVI